MTTLTLSQARKIIEVALARSRERGYAPMGIAVLDAAGKLKAFATLAQRAKDNPNFFLSLAATAEGKFLPQPGAVVIKDAQGQVLGAVGASGGTGDQDEEICAAGVTALGLVAG